MSKTTLWLWPSGLFPRRIIYYLRLKQITLSNLSTQDFHLIPCTLTPTSIASLPGYEVRPPNTSLPLLRVEQANGEVHWIRESAAILEYFEDVFKTEGCARSLIGDDVLQKARTREVVSVLDEAQHWGIVHIIHSNPATISWSGLSVEGMSSLVAAHAKRKFHAALSKLEGWVEKDVVKEGAVSLSGGGRGMLADVLLMASVEYLGMMYGVDWVEEHGVLRVWYERAKMEDWFVGNTALKKVEDEGEWQIVLKV